MLITKVEEINLIPILSITNNEKTFTFDVHDTFKKTANLETLFTCTNKYQDLLTDEQQNELMDILGKISTLTVEGYEEASVKDELQGYIKRVVEIYNPNQFTIWFRDNHDGLHFPEKMIEKFIFDPDQGSSAEKTYTKSEYVDFISMVLFFRMLTPFYNDYLDYLIISNRHPRYMVAELFKDTDINPENEMTSDSLIEEELFEQLEEANLTFYKRHLTLGYIYAKDRMGNIIDHTNGIVVGRHFSPYNKLEEYIEVNHLTLVGKKDRQHLVLGAGLSEDAIVGSLVGSIIFGKIITMDFFDGTNNTIGNVFNCIKFGGTFKSSLTNNLKVKSTPTADTGDGDRAVFESSKDIIELSLGTMVTLQIGLSNNHQILRALGYDPNTFDWDFYNEEMKHLNEYMSRPIEKVRVYLLGWFLHKHINARAVKYLEENEKRRVVELLILAKTALYMSGHSYIGTFLGCYKDTESNYINPSTTSKSTLNKLISIELASMYTHHIDDRGLTYEKVIVDFSKQITNLPWRAMGQYDQRYINDDGYLIAPNNIQEVMFEYVKFINGAQS